jgi:hypothetical protein
METSLSWVKESNVAKIKTYKVTDAKDAKKMTDSVNKVLKILGLAEYVKCKVPADAWIKTNAPDGKLDVILEASVDPKSHQGPIKVSARASNGTTSVMGVYTMAQAMFDKLQKELTAAGLI